MKEQSFRIQYLPNNIVLEILYDELDLIRTAKLISEVDLALCYLKDSGLIIDLANINFIDSSGISFIYSLKKNHGPRFNSFSVVCSNKNVIQVFEIFNMLKYFDVYPGLEDAVKDKMFLNIK